MAIKTNKSFAKRLKITKSGKVLARKPGQNHFNAKENTQAKSAKRKRVNFPMTAKEKSRFLVNIKNS
jgi:ribosomal protein L35